VEGKTEISNRPANCRPTRSGSRHSPHIFVIHEVVLWLTQSPETADPFQLRPVHNGRSSAPISRVAQIHRRGLKMANGAPG